MPLSLPRQGGRNINVPNPEDFFAAEFGRFAGNQEFPQVGQIPAQWARQFVLNAGVVDQGSNLRAARRSLDFGLGSDHVCKLGVGGDVLDLRLLAGQQRGDNAPAGLQGGCAAPSR